MQQKIVFAMLLLFPFMHLAKARVIHDEQLWVNFNSFFSVGEKWQICGEYQPRIMENRKYLKAALYRTALEYKIRDNLALGIGYAFVEYPHPRYFHEDRPFLQSFHVTDMNRLRIINRTRFEGRIFRHDDETSLRLRHMLRLQYALTHHWRLIGWEEWFWNANSIEPSARSRAPILREGFDQNRAFLGIGLAYGEKLQHLGEIGYLNQYVNSPALDRSHHTVFIQSTWRF